MNWRGIKERETCPNTQWWHCLLPFGNMVFLYDSFIPRAMNITIYKQTQINNVSKWEINAIWNQWLSLLLDRANIRRGPVHHFLHSVREIEDWLRQMSRSIKRSRMVWKVCTTRVVNEHFESVSHLIFNAKIKKKSNPTPVTCLTPVPRLFQSISCLLFQPL